MTQRFFGIFEILEHSFPSEHFQNVFVVQCPVVGGRLFLCSSIKRELHYIRFSIVIRNGKTVWKRGSYCWYFCLNLKYLGWSYRAYIKTAKNGDFWENLVKITLSLFFTFCCYDHGAKASETVQEIATDQKECRRCSSYIIICWIAKIYLSINNSENDWLQGYLRRS